MTTGPKHAGRARRIARLAGAPRVLFAFAAPLALLLAPARAQGVPEAKAVRFVVIAATDEQTGNPGHHARKAAQLLASGLEGHGLRVLAAEQARRLYEQRGSAPPIPVTASDVDALARDAQQALYHVASGLYSRAQQDVARAMERARRALESLNRESRAARHLLDACMYLVRGQLEHKDRAEARRQALECRRLVPDIEPDTTMHPPDVIGVLAEAEAELLSREPSSLRIESEPMGCAVLVNGRNLGTTPKELPRLSPGEYRVQVECHDGEPGRVHRAVLGNNRVVVKVDTRFDRTVQTAFDLSLRYPNRDQQELHRVRDALEAARTVGATDLVLVWLAVPDARADAAAVQARRFRVDDGVQLASAELTLDASGSASPADVKQTVQALLEARPVVAAAPRPAPATVAPAGGVDAQSASEPLHASALAGAEHWPGERAAETEIDAAHRGAQPLRVAAYAAAGVGLAANLAGWALYAHALGVQGDYARALNAGRADRFDRHREVGELGTVNQLTLGAGAGVLTASLPLWLPEQPGVPTWAWAAGGAGLLAAAVGAKLALDAGSCLQDELGRCTNAVLATDLGVQLLLQSIPLLAVPLVYAAREWIGSGADDGRLEFRASPDRLYLRWTQRL